MKRIDELYNYLVNCARAERLKEQIVVYENKLDMIDRAIDASKFRTSTIDELAEEAHRLRLKLLGLKVELNVLERKILQFELAEELRD